MIVANRNGIPDLLVCYKGRFIAFEIKSENGKLTELQNYNLELIKEAGGEAYMIKSLSNLKLILTQINIMGDV